MIPGLTYTPNAISERTHDALLELIDVQPWRKDLKRRVQHYGWRYDYTRKQITRDMYLGVLPDWLTPLRNHVQQAFGEAAIEQVIINEYLPGQGIGAHVDCVPCFGDTVATISLCSAVEMEFRSVIDRASTRQLSLEPRSLLILTNEARYKWTHAIAQRIHDGDVLRSRRVSVTFRSIRHENT